ncbi:hypothetical protein ANO11243_095810 [Dothideomycetidae sp. 11243]|nr:hypothetical protein ANO11243_095810 [fungal sp. No.11243]
MSINKTYLVTGASRGIGLGLVTELLARPSTTVIAGVRDPAKASSALEALPHGSGSRLIIVKLDSTKEIDAAAAIAELQNKHGVKVIDVVYANAGINGGIPKTLDLTTTEATEVFVTNSIAPFVLAAAARELLKKSQHPVFAAATSGAGSITGLNEYTVFMPMSPYGASKAALNWFTNRLHFEEPWLTTVLLDPGLVVTDMAKDLLDKGIDVTAFGPVKLEDCVKGLLKVIDNAEKDKIGGKVVN